MQLVSQDKNERKMIRRACYAVVVPVAAVGVMMGVSRLKSASPIVDRSAIQIATVRRGLMTRKVQGLGVLVPEEVRWLAAATEGHVDQCAGKAEHCDSAIKQSEPRSSTRGRGAGDEKVRGRTCQFAGSTGIAAFE